MALIIPEVYAEIVRQKFEGKVKVANLAVALGELSNTTVGGEISFPKFKNISDCSEVIKGTASDISSLDQTESKAKIKMVDKIVRVFEMDNLTALGNQVEEASSQTAVVIARKLNLDLITEALTSPLKIATVSATAITALELNSALAMFQDEQDVEDMAGIVINSLLTASFYNMPEFVSNRTDTVAGNGIVTGGCIGYWRGVPIFLAKHGTYDKAKAECITLVIKKNALAYMKKRAINIVEELEPKLHSSCVIGDYIYACKLIADDGVVVVRKTIV
ncbi:hypothetical protein [Clostridium estertheticum]|uniref:hypothetical protein n=1 Tax=Clostridium estertheticum TaxID=238834 RepID=UPI001C7D4A69|nr:hypothetical protein [Clostridium estertheticum]MBX4271457.1 hypothetical protein [Clostridium estertheticum]WLC81010.1 hypothetical protein KTC98_07240 [Clostridium estertheticum]